MIHLLALWAGAAEPVPLGLGPEPHRFSFRVERDAVHLGVGVGLAGLATVVPELAGARRPVLTATAPGLYPDLLFGDQVFDDRHRTWAAPLSHPLTAGAVAASVGVPLELGTGSARRNLGRSLIQTEVLLVNSAVTSVLKAAVHGPRPFVQAGRCAHADGERLTCVSSKGETRTVPYRDALASFPSGHTSWTGAATFGWATVRLRATGGRFGWDDLLVYGLATGLTAASGLSRVEAGAHHPTDVLAGGLLGAAAGIGIPLLH